MSFQETFHGRPPLRVYPDLVRDERELGDRSQFQTFALSDGPLNLTAAVDPSVILPKLPDARSTRIRARPAVQAFADGGSSATLVAAAPGDRSLVTAVPSACGRGTKSILRPRTTSGNAAKSSSRFNRRMTTPFSTRGISTRVKGSLSASSSARPRARRRALRSFAQPRAADGARLRYGPRRREHGPRCRRGQDLPLDRLAIRIRGGNREELHRRLATLRSYPALLRRLGLVIDLHLETEIPRDGHIRVVPLAEDAKLDIAHAPTTRSPRPLVSSSLCGGPNRCSSTVF